MKITVKSYTTSASGRTVAATLPRIPHSKSNFADWLLSLNRTGIAGVRSSADSCPYARYLKARAAKGIAVAGGTVTYNGHSEPTPAWLRAFTENVDAGGGIGTDITANAALRALIA